MDRVGAALASLVETSLKAVAKAVFSEATVERVDGTTAVLAVPNDGYIQRGDKYVADVAGALSTELGAQVSVQLVVAGAGAVSPSASASPTAAPMTAPAPSSAPASPAGAAAASTAAAPADDAPTGDAPTGDAVQPGSTETESAAAAVAAADGNDDDSDDDDEDLTSIDVSELEDAADVATTGVDRLTRAFPGAVLVDEGDTTS